MSEKAYRLARASVVGGVPSPRQAGAGHAEIRGVGVPRPQWKRLDCAVPSYTKTIRGLCWFAAVTGLALLPKCFACLAGYLAVFTGLATVTPELCGTGDTGTPDSLGYLFASGSLMTAAGISLWLMARNRPPMSERDGHER